MDFAKRFDGVVENENPGNQSEKSPDAQIRRVNVKQGNPHAYRSHRLDQRSHSFQRPDDAHHL